MNLKTYFRRNVYLTVCICLAVLSCFSCAPRVMIPSSDAARMPVPMPSSTPVPDDPAPPDVEEKQPPMVQEPNPRMLASLELTQQGKYFIAKNQLDSAINTLEKAIALEPGNGQNYFYLAEALLLKGLSVQALNFNELADMHLGTDEKWKRRISDQRHRIQEWKKILE